jgi:hypothetical protein
LTLPNFPRTLAHNRLMEIQLEDLEYQRRAIAAVAGVLQGQIRNSFDNSNLFGIQANVTDLTPAQIEENKKKVISENGVAETVDYFKIHKGKFFICFELALDTTMKWNLKHNLGEKLKAI